MISRRHAVVLSALLAAALVPTIVHSYLGLKARDSRRIDAIPEEMAGAKVIPPDRQPTWTKAAFASDEAFERLYGTTDGRTARLVVIRSHDAKRLYHHPELAVAYATGYDEQAVGRLSARPDIPVHMLRRTVPPPPALGLYVLLYDEVFIDDPYTHQMRSLWAQLFAPRRPMTLLFAYAEGPGLESTDQSLPAQVLLAAIEAFTTQGDSARP